MMGMPTFSPSLTHTRGLEMIAEAATETSTSQPPLPPLTGLNQRQLSLHQADTFLPGASLPTKLVKRILNLDFIEMAEISTDEPVATNQGRPNPPKLPITDIRIWLEKFP